MPYKLSNEAKLDLARIYWHGVEAFGELQADRYYEILIQRLSYASNKNCKPGAN